MLLDLLMGRDQEEDGKLVPDCPGNPVVFKNDIEYTPGCRVWSLGCGSELERHSI